MKSLENSNTSPIRVLVVLHIYYEEYLPYYLDKLKNINGCEWDMIVTGCNLSEHTRRIIAGFKNDVMFYDTPNIGYDVWPFIYAIKRTDLNKYCFIVKIHTKNQDKVVNYLNGIAYTGTTWRSELVNALLGSEEQFNKLLAVFRHRKRVGIAYAMSLDIIRRDNLIEDSGVLSEEMKRLGMKSDVKHFCGGTMFAVRAAATKWIKDDRITENIFQQSKGSHNTATMAHVYERILSMAVTENGYETFLIRTSWSKYFFIKVKRYIQPLLEWLFSINYHGTNHEKFITVFGYRFKLNK